MTRRSPLDARSKLLAALALSLLGCELKGDLGEHETNGGNSGSDDGGSKGDKPCSPGDSKLADDGCNSCTCDDAGQWACTALGCVCTPEDCGPAPGMSDVLCPDGTYAGTVCAATPSGCGWVPEECGGSCMPGDNKPAGDGCNTCTCDGAGQWGCTALWCACEPDQCDPLPPNVVPCPDGSNPYQCVWTADGECQWEGGECPPCEPGMTANPDGSCCICTEEGEWACGDACPEPACEPDDCGPQPPVAPCPGGSGPTVECMPSSTGECEWHVGPCPEDGLCVASGGEWVDNTCGHYTCGVPHACTPDTAGPGCNCGPERNFTPGLGCEDDSDCTGS
jgi:hypothetical protein